ncbi:MAG: hypothetical protein AAB890_03440 [Patescibacteria group bacterium]
MANGILKYFFILVLLLVCTSNGRVAAEEKNNYKVRVNAIILVVPCNNSSRHMHVKTETTFMAPDELSFSTHGVGEILGQLLGIEVHEQCERIIKNQEGVVVITKSHFLIANVDKIGKVILSQVNYINSKFAF